MATRTPKKAAPEMPPEYPEHTLMNETDESLVAAVQSVFQEDLADADELEPTSLSEIKWDDVAETAASTEVQERAARLESTNGTERAGREESTVPTEREFGRPGIGDMITVKGGGLYLPVRRRVVWMRGEPVPHPDWTIDTVAEKVVEGTFKGNKVEGGYARYRANLFDESGRLVSTGTKTEYSERFLDFVEKAETGSIGRALAVAGYGTEAAVDLDEGLDQERIADAPVVPSRPITITSSSVPGVRAGGRPAQITEAQVREVARLSSSMHLGAALIPVMEEIKKEPMRASEEGENINEVMLEFLRSFSFEQAGELIQKLSNVLQKRQGTS